MSVKIKQQRYFFNVSRIFGITQNILMTFRFLLFMKTYCQKIYVLRHLRKVNTNNNNNNNNNNAIIENGRNVAEYKAYGVFYLLAGCSGTSYLIYEGNPWGGSIFDILLLIIMLIPARTFADLMPEGSMQRNIKCNICFECILCLLVLSYNIGAR